MTREYPGGSARNGTTPKRTTHPHPSLASLEERLSHLQASSIERSTYVGYRVALRDWLSFCRLYSFDTRPTVRTIGLYITYCDARSISSISTYLSGLSFFFTRHYPEWPAIRQSPSVLRTLRGAAKHRARPVSRKDPLRVNDIFRFLALPMTTSFSVSSSSSDSSALCTSGNSSFRTMLSCGYTGTLSQDIRFGSLTTALHSPSCCHTTNQIPSIRVRQSLSAPI
jgi:hypothetical protein